MECTQTRVMSGVWKQGGGVLFQFILFHATHHFPLQINHIYTKPYYIAYTHEHTYNYSYSVYNLIQKELNLCIIHAHKCMHTNIISHAYTI